MIVSEQVIHPIRITYGDFQDDDAILDITTDKRYWRTSKLLQIDVIRHSGQEIMKYTGKLEQEQDEPDLLLLLTKWMQGINRIITYNGDSFDLPHLKKKYEAYGYEYGLHGRKTRDLYREYQPYSVMFGLPSRKLVEYATMIHLPVDQLDDATMTFELLSLDTLTAFFDLDWNIAETEQEDGYLYYTLELNHAIPVRLSFHDEIYHVILDGNRAKISVKILNGMIRRYYTDTKEYVYLPLEGYAIHKSMASYVEKNHKEKAVRTNCFSLISYSELFLTDKTYIRQYLITALRFLQSRQLQQPHSQEPS